MQKDSILCEKQIINIYIIFEKEVMMTFNLIQFKQIFNIQKKSEMLETFDNDEVNII